MAAAMITPGRHDQVGIAMCPFAGRSAVSLIPALTASANVVLYEGVGVFDPQPQPRLVMTLPRARVPGMIDRVGHDALGHATLRPLRLQIFGAAPHSP